MNRRLIIIITILLILGLVFILFPARREKPPEEGEEVITNREVVPGVPEGLPEREIPEISPEEKLKRDLSSRARSFASRFGSYSTDADWQNLYELRPQMTSSFWQEQEAYIEKAREEGTVPERGLSPGEFYGVTTKALSVKLVEFDPETKAEFLVSCQRQETRGAVQSVFAQDIEIIFVKVGEKWLVDSAVWQ